MAVEWENERVGSRVLFRGPFELDVETVPVAAGPGEDEVLIRTEYSLISPGTELALYTGTHVGIGDPANRWAKFPFYPGYSIAGRIEAVGERVRGFAPGDRVYTIGKHASYNTAVWNSRQQPLIKLADTISGEVAVFARLAAICMTSVVQSEIRFGDTAVVLGLGLIGNLAAQLYSILGANVVGVDKVERRLAIASGTAIDRVVLSRDETPLSEQIRECTGGAEPDIVVEATGSPHLIVPALELVRRLGQAVALGSTRGNVDLNVYELIHRKGIRFIGAHEGLQNASGFPDRSTLTEYALKLIGRGALKIDPLISHHLPGREAKTGYELLLNQKDQALGVLLDWSRN